MRGKACPKSQIFRFQRITPAYAGKRLIFTGLLLIIWDHPRLCGEKARHNRGTDFVPGSPPPMRGKGYSLLGATYKLRITPAYAGKSP